MSAQWRSADYVIAKHRDVSWTTLDVIDDLKLAERMIAIHESALRVRARAKIHQQPLNARAHSD